MDIVQKRRFIYIRNTLLGTDSLAEWPECLDTNHNVMDSIPDNSSIFKWIRPETETHEKKWVAT